MKWKLFCIFFLIRLSSSQPANGGVDPKLLIEIFGTPPPRQADPIPTTNRPSTVSKSLDDYIQEVFGPPPKFGPENNNPVKSPNYPVVNTNIPEDDNCECVNYYTCLNGTIITDGVGIIDIRFGESKCSNYLETCCLPSNIDRTKRFSSNRTNSVGCGNRHVNGVGFRITGANDNESEFGEFPWMVAVLRPDEASLNNKKDLKFHYQCGGSLIHRQAVLTAAHCVKGLNSWDLVVRAGEWDTQTQSEPLPHQNRDVARIIMHPNFKSGNLHNDFAVLILTQPMELAENVDTVCLPDQYEVFDNTRCVASGWGKNVFGKQGEYQVILKRIDLPAINHAVCQNSLRETRLGKYFQLHESFMCAGGEPGKDTCKGDGGSPLVCPLRNDPTRYLQAGIVSWGIGCGEDGVPGVYANVAYASEWINMQLRESFDQFVG